MMKGLTGGLSLLQTHGPGGEGLGGIEAGGRTITMRPHRGSDVMMTLVRLGSSRLGRCTPEEVQEINELQDMKTGDKEMMKDGESRED